MILFCEDCGEKNDLDSAALIGGKAVFKCATCNYPNSYSITDASTSAALDTRACFFTQIRDTSNMIGGFLYHSQQGVVGQQMPSILAMSDIETLGAGLSQSYDNGQTFCLDLDKITVVISDKYFSIFKVGSHLYAVVIGTGPGLPENLVNCITDLEKLER